MRKNEIRLDIKKEVVDIFHAINEESLVVLRRKKLGIEEGENLAEFLQKFSK